MRTRAALGGGVSAVVRRRAGFAAEAILCAREVHRRAGFTAVRLLDRGVVGYRDGDLADDGAGCGERESIADVRQLKGLLQRSPVKDSLGPLRTFSLTSALTGSWSSSRPSS